MTSFQGSRRRHTPAKSDPATSNPVSTESADLMALTQRIQQEPELDAAKVVDLNRRLTAGEFEIDAHKLAGKLLDLEQQFDP